MIDRYIRFYSHERIQLKTGGFVIGIIKYMMGRQVYKK